MAGDAPLVSCPMVTTPSDDRLPFVRRSIAAHLRQTHHRKELLIIVQPDWRRNAEVVRDHVDRLRRSDIRILESGPGNHRMLADRLSPSCGPIPRRELAIRADPAAYDFVPGRFTFCGGGNSPALGSESWRGALRP